MLDEKMVFSNSGRLGAIFLSHVPEDRRAPFAALADLDAALAGLVEAGRSAWPEIRMAPADFVAFLGQSLPEDAASTLASLRAAELHLVCAYGLGTPGASEALEAHYMRRVEAALGRIGAPAPIVADVLADLRRRLVEMQLAQAGGYAGRGDLAAWLCVSAVREANRRRDRWKKERPLEEVSDEVLATPPEGEPEMAHLREVYKEEFQAAFREALASLTDRDRTILRYYFIDDLGIDDLGRIYGVHRVTAFRWVEQARKALARRTRELLAERMSLSQDGFGRMLTLIQSQINVHPALAQA
jgi:RNA polymerase sigma-70 factor (ECF subfamily)